jgi:hypothetical protein
MGGGRIAGPLGVQDDDELVSRPFRPGELTCHARPPGAIGLTGFHDHPVLDTPGPTGVNDHGDHLSQCRIRIDPVLLERNRVIEAALLDGAEVYYQKEDLRWFFSYAHAQITRQINANLTMFQNPNALLQLNIHFAEEFVRAIDGQPHELWKEAFAICASLQRNPMIFIPEVEICGARMANVHIHVDLANALREVGCISPQDYGNMLVFVNRGSLAALVRLRGRPLAAAEAMFNQLMAPLLELEVKAWRNAVFEAACHVRVPDPAVQQYLGR